MAATKATGPGDIRNVGIVGHSQSGKTAVAGAILFNKGVTTRIGNTEDGTSVMDFEPEEIKRGYSVASHFGWVQHQGKKVNLIDTPGDQNFFLDGLTSLMGADAIIGVVCALDGVQMQLKRAWASAAARNLPRLLFINKMDRVPGEKDELLKNAADSLKAQLVALQIPIYSGEVFKGVVDLVTQTALTWDKGDGSGEMTKGEIPADLADAVKSATENFVETVVSTDDALLERYLDTGDVSMDEVRQTMYKTIKTGDLVPVLFGSATENIGVQPLLDLAVEVFPSPLEAKVVTCKDDDGNDVEAAIGPDEKFLAQVIHTSQSEHAGQISMIRVFSGTLPKDGHLTNADTEVDVRMSSAFAVQGRDRVKLDQVICGDIIGAVKLKDTHTNNTLCAPKNVRFLPKTTYPNPMIAVVLKPESKSDDDKIKQSLQKLMEEDPTLSISLDELTHRMVLSGMGQAHLDCAIERMARMYNVHVKTAPPPVSYCETIAKPVTGIEGKHKKQSGGAGQFGVCFIDVEPLPRDGGFEFVDKIFGGSIPRQFIPSVEKGVIDGAKRGLVAGYPVVDFRVTLKDGKYHSVDSKDIAFQKAGSKALRSAMDQAGMQLLEPYYKMEIAAPMESSGAIAGDINSRRGHIDGIDATDDGALIRATCPQSEILMYVPDLHSMTGGRGSYTMEFDTYHPVPEHLIPAIRKQSPFLKDSEQDDD